MNVFLFELRSQRKTILIWSLVLVLVCLFFMAMYPSYSSNIPEMKKMLSGYPPQLLSALGLDLNALGSVTGYYPFVLLYVGLCGSIAALNLSIGSVSRENLDKTADFLLTKPVSRVSLLTAKICSVFCSLIAINLIYIIFSLLIALLFKTSSFSLEVFVLMSLVVFFTELAFMAVGVLIGVLYKKIKSVSTISVSVAFLFFVVSMLGEIISAENVKYMTPFKFFDLNYIAAHKSYEASSLISVLVVLLICLLTSYIFYTKQDTKAI